MKQKGNRKNEFLGICSRARRIEKEIKEEKIEKGEGIEKMKMRDLIILVLSMKDKQGNKAMDRLHLEKTIQYFEYLMGNRK